MTKIEALRLELAAREMVEGTGLEWIDVIREYGKPLHHYILNGERDQYELALGIVEGKPVWEGDMLYFPDGTPIEVRKSTLLCKKDGGVFDLSWNPPKPKTVMVELLVEDTKVYVRRHTAEDGVFTRVIEACRKALEGVK